MSVQGDPGQSFPSVPGDPPMGGAGPVDVALVGAPRHGWRLRPTGWTRHLPLSRPSARSARGRHRQGLVVVTAVLLAVLLAGELALTNTLRSPAVTPRPHRRSPPRRRCPPRRAHPRSPAPPSPAPLLRRAPRPATARRRARVAPRRGAAARNADTTAGRGGGSGVQGPGRRRHDHRLRRRAGRRHRHRADRRRPGADQPPRRRRLDRPSASRTSATARPTTRRCSATTAPTTWRSCG